MPFFSKSASPSSASSSPTPTPPSSSSPSSLVNPFSKKKLERQKKLRYATDESPDPTAKMRSSAAMPQPLPLPDMTCPRRSESSCSNPGPDHHGSSPEERPISSLRRTSTDHSPTKSKEYPSNFRQRFSQYANIETSNRDFQLRIPARSAPTSGFSSPSASPQRLKLRDVGGDPFLSCLAAESARSPSNCRRGSPHDANSEIGNCNLRRISSPSSAPTSGLASPVVSPQRSNTFDFLPSMGRQDIHCQSALEDLSRLDDHATKGVRSPNRAQGPSPKSPKKFSFPCYHKFVHGRSKEWPESNGVSAHPLPLPPGAGPSLSFMLSPPPSIHHATDRPHVSPVKGQWLKGRLLGCGTYGRVYCGTHRDTGASCAMKEVDIVPDDPKSAECIKQLEQEIRFLRKLEHPNIVQYYGSEIVGDHFYIYLELVHPGPINRYVNEHCAQITESIVRNFTRHILSGLAFLHSKKTIHRDIKGANLLVDASGTVKLADFGMAKHLKGLSYQLSLKGSPHWMAPEVIRAEIQKDAKPDLALAVDIWSLGCTIIEMFTGKPPWGELQGAQAMFKVLNKSPPIPETLSHEGKDFLHRCFQRNPADRLSAAKLLEHPFVRSSNDIKVPVHKQPSSPINMEKMPSPRDCTSHKTDSMPTSPRTQVANGKLHSNRETTQQNHSPFVFNCSTVSHHSTYSTHEVLPGLHPPQSVHASHSFSSSPNSNVPFGSGNNHPLAVLRSHGREVPHI